MTLYTRGPGEEGTVQWHFTKFDRCRYIYIYIQWLLYLI